MVAAEVCVIGRIHRLYREHPLHAVSNPTVLHHLIVNVNDASAHSRNRPVLQALLSLSLVATSHVNPSPSSSDSPQSTAGPTAPPQSNKPSTIPGASTTASHPDLPTYISLSNMPLTHWQPVAPFSMPPQPPLPAIPGRSRGGDGSGSAAAGGGSGRPTSQGRRTSVSNMASSSGPMTQASR
jgi:hypothetical protein